MQTVYCFFSYALDDQCLAQAIRSIRLSDPRGKIAVFDDGTKPLPKLPASDFYEKTYFARNGNLNGRECITGELLCFAKAARLTGASHVAKVDCDTVVIRPDVALRLAVEANADLYGSSWHDFGVWGPFYILRAGFLHRMIEVAPTLADMSDEEDMGMTAIARAAKGNVVVVPWAAKFFNGLDYRQRDFDFERFCDTNAVTCGNRMQIQGDDVHGVVARAMEGLIDFLHTRKPFDWSRVLRGAQSENPEPSKSKSGAQSKGIAVIVTCHAGYLHFLPESLAAWDEQQPHKKILVLDGCDYDAPAGWEKVTGKWRHPNKARNAGLSACSGHTWVIHWDADNVPQPGFLDAARSKAATAEDNVGVFYSDVAADDTSGKSRIISDDRCGDPRESFFIDTASLWRRDAILHVGGWTPHNNKLDDWDLGRRLYAAGWKLKRLDAVAMMRDHAARRTYQASTSEALWGVRPIGIITLFAGRMDMLERWFNAVEQHELPSRCGLTVVDDSRCAVFRSKLEFLLKKIMPKFERVTILGSGETRAPRGYDEVHHRVGRFYSRAIAATPEAVILTWEDDVFPKSRRALRALSDRMQPKQRVAAVSAAYRCRENALVAVGSLDAQYWKTMPLFSWLGSDVKQVGMVGGGFVLWSRAALEQCPIFGSHTLPEGVKLGWDGFVCRRLNEAGWKILLHGGVSCEHLCA